MKSLLWNHNIVFKGNGLLSFSRVRVQCCCAVLWQTESYFDEVFQANEL